MGVQPVEMAPKAKAAMKARARPGGRAGVRMRPTVGRGAGVPPPGGRGQLRRPAGRRGEAPALDVTAEWRRGDVVELRRLGLEKFVKGMRIVVT